MFGLLKNLLIVIILFGSLYAVTLFSSDVKKQADAQLSKVLGAKTVKEDKTTALPDDLKKDAKEQIDDAKKKAMHVNLSDVLQTVNRLQKIPKDLDDLKNGIEDQVGGLFGK